MDRTACEPFFVVTPYVVVENGLWRMWYCGCTEWLLHDGVTEPRYQIKYAESTDGVSWVRNDVTCIPYEASDEVSTRPCVIRSADGTYRMWYCYRKIGGYRTDRSASYRIGYAESFDGITWERQDRRAGIEPSGSGWDSEMLAYPFVYEYRSTTYLLYNGNGFGASGFGYAVLEAA